MTKTDILKMAEEFEKKNDVKILYLSKFGSHLYGTNTPESDTDIRGIFLPSKESLLLERRCRSLSYGTGDNKSKNTKEDIDFNLWSIHYFLELVRKGETNALDILFSPSNEECVIIKDSRMDKLFENPLKLFDPSKTTALVSYCIDQAKRYGVRGSRLGVIKRAYTCVKREIAKLELLKVPLFPVKIKDIVDNIIEECNDPTYCFKKTIRNVHSLVLCGKVHNYNISITELYTRLEKDYTRYGERARLAEKNEGIDWKAISHAVRAIDQMKYLLTDGKINFPLKKRDLLTDIKSGKVPWNKAEEVIMKGLSDVEELTKNTVVKGKVDMKFIDEFVLSLYKGCGNDSGKCLCHS